MKVKCRICGQYIDKDKAYRVEKYNKNMYYCSEEEYLEYKRKQSEQSKQKADMYRMIEQFIGKTTNTALFKEVNIWLSAVDHSTVCRYFKENETRIKAAMNKEFSSEYAKIRYFSAIVKNNIGSYKDTEKEVVRNADTEIYDVKYTKRNKRRCLDDYKVGDKDR